MRELHSVGGRQENGMNRTVENQMSSGRRRRVMFRSRRGRDHRHITTQKSPAMIWRILGAEFRKSTPSHAREAGCQVCGGGEDERGQKTGESQ